MLGILFDTIYRDLKTAGGLPPAARFVPKEAVSSSALLTATLLARAVLIALLFPLTAFTFLFFAILPALLSGGVVLARFVWILLCIHDAFLCC
jgi:hypothetical protein